MRTEAESEKQTIAVFLSEDVARLLSENEIDLLTALQSQNLDVQRTERPPDLATPGVRKMSVELIILVSVAAVPIVAHAIVRIIDAISGNKKAVITESAHSTTVSFLGFTVTLTDFYGKQ
jgi:hypothetical protein